MLPPETFKQIDDLLREREREEMHVFIKFYNYLPKANLILANYLNMKLHEFFNNTFLAKGVII